jgi:hypothetical protein
VTCTPNKFVHVQTQIQDLLSHNTPINQVGSNTKPPNGYSNPIELSNGWTQNPQKTIFFTYEMILIVRLESPLPKQSRSLVQ